MQRQVPQLVNLERAIDLPKLFWICVVLYIIICFAQHVAGNSDPKLVYSAIFTPTNDELSDVIVIIPFDGRPIYNNYILHKM